MNVIDLAKSWWAHCHSKTPQHKLNWFWWDLTEDTVSADWRSPWGIWKSANFAHDFGSDYKGWTVQEIYALFCDEDRYIAHLENQGRIK